MKTTTKFEIGQEVYAINSRWGKIEQGTIEETKKLTSKCGETVQGYGIMPLYGKDEDDYFHAAEEYVSTNSEDLHRIIENAYIKKHFKVVLTQKSYDDLQNLMTTSKNFTMWFGKTEPIENGVQITEIIIPQQKNTMTESSVTREDMQELLIQHGAMNLNCYGTIFPGGGKTLRHSLPDREIIKEISQAYPEIFISSVANKDKFHFYLWRKKEEIGIVPWEIEC